MDRTTDATYRLAITAFGRFMILLWFFHAVSGSVSALAQDDQNAAMAAFASPQIITEWLSGKEPRLVAWEAYAARESSDPEMLNRVVDRLKVAVEDPDLTFRTPYGPDFEANEMLLDALIQRRAALPIEVTRRLRDIFPAQAALLASQLPPEVRLPLLQEWYAGRNYGHNDSLARVAAMLLAKTPPAGFAASILAESEDHLMIQVVSGVGSSGFGGSAGGACGDGGGAGPKKDWPPLFFYPLEENSRITTDRLLVEAGGDRVTARRISGSGGFGSCHSVGPLSTETNHHLLAEMLRTDDAGVPFPTRHDLTILWTDQANFKSDLGSVLETEDATLHQAIFVFRERGLLSQDEAESVLPRLIVSIHFDPAIKH